MINEKDISLATPSSSPTPGPFRVTDSGRIVPANAKNEELEYIADIQTAPNGPRNVSILCASSLMLTALKTIKQDPRHKRLGRPALEALEEALTAGE